MGQKNIFRASSIYVQFISLNLHLEQLRASDKKPEVLILGSSMAFNNIDAAKIDSETGWDTYNLSSWGQKIQESSFLLSLPNTQRLKLVLLPINIMDFKPNSANIIDTNKAKHFVKNEQRLSFVLDYLRNFNAILHEIELLKLVYIQPLMPI